MTISPHLAKTSPFPLGVKVDRAKECYVYSSDGTEYLDLISGLAVANIGHCHPEITAAIKDQSEKYLHTIPFGEFSQKPQNDLADRLASILPEKLNCSYFVNSGTEANEAALKLAKRSTGRHEIVAIKGSYHGATHGSLSVTGNEVKKQAFRPMLPGVTFIEHNNLDDIDKISNSVAAVIIEPVMGDAGVRIPAEGYLQALRNRCDVVGALLIFDEVQTGFGRIGSMFAFERLNVVPDILTIAKAFGGGMPIGAFISSQENMELLTHDPMLGHITTFGGHPVCCAAALANINVLQSEKWIAETESKGDRFKNQLTHESIIEIRQIGLMLAVELKSEGAVVRVIEKLLARGIIGFYFLSCRNAFRLAPPLCITNEQIDWACSEINQALDS